ncbi:ABC-type transporter, integral membrane subunit [Spirochaeta thermophila DSM 6578]|uniref:ABC-type transporter, integral membrane subunit n=1 Tax=Winmispira thermophila (strain ATCC 700085 / DSM 6578 / Z-1203) TaxID=869211 RepID=G0GFH8_WINT7|nr:carbohydrate ABC transporter permease [Spirochaeta thermophila]AEJ61592.1 ABC-type transporter, integral membrane subunit [Spirochaeta thermophila DSM 6578]
MRKMNRRMLELLAAGILTVAFGVPFLFVILNAGKSTAEAASMAFSLPSSPQYLENLGEVFRAGRGMVLRGFYNSARLTIFTILVLTVVSAMTGFVLERRQDRVGSLIQFLVMTGLMLPPAVVPTIWVLKGLGLYRTLLSMVMIEVALGFPFAVLLYRAFMVSIPRDLDEAALIDGCGPLYLFFRIIFPLLKPVSVTITILTAITVYNDFVNPLYFLPGAENVTIQLSLYNFQTQFTTRWNLLFADVLVIAVPPFLFYLFFRRQIVEGMVAGAIKA